MRKLSRSIMSIAIIGLLSCSSYSAEGDSVNDEPGMNSRSTLLRSTTISQSSSAPVESLRENKVENKSGHTSGRGLIKTLMMGALMLSAPTVVEAQNPGFVGAYVGVTANSLSETNNISIGSLATTNWNSYYLGTTSSLVSFPSFSIKIECEENQESYCKYMYIKSAYLCNKIFNVNYYSSIIYNPQGINSNTVYSSTTVFTNGAIKYANDYWKNFYLGAFNSLSPESNNNTDFDTVFSGYMTNKKC